MSCYAMLFPLNITTVFKNAVPFILKAGTWMRTELDEDGQRIVLLSKRTAGLRPDADDENQVELQSLPDVPAAPTITVVSGGGR